MAAVAPQRATRSFALLRATRYALAENRLTLVACMLFCLLLLCAVLGGAAAPYDPLATDTTARLQSPTLAHLFGTDALGRDILSRVMVAARLDLGMAVSAVAVSFLIGTALGAMAGYLGGAADAVFGVHPLFWC